METSAKRVGKRIREIRNSKGLSQAELGERVGLTADRIQKYENGARKPKIDLLCQIATALGVEPLALLDPVLDDEIGIMYALFSLEEFGLQIKRVDGCLYLCFGDGSSGILNEYLSQWERVRKFIEVKSESCLSAKERKVLKKRYKMWEWTFPQSLNDKSLQRNQIQAEILRLRKELLSLKDE